MGLIGEPKNIDFCVIDKAWSQQERQEFGELIKQRKEQLKKAEQRKAARAKRHIIARQKSNPQWLKSHAEYRCFTHAFYAESVYRLTKRLLPL